MTVKTSLHADKQYKIGQNVWINGPTCKLKWDIFLSYEIIQNSKLVSVIDDGIGKRVVLDNVGGNVILRHPCLLVIRATNK